MKRMPIRLRLTLWYAAVLAVILIAFSVLLIQILSVELRDQFDTSLEARSALLVPSLEAANAGTMQDIDDDILLLLYGRDGTIGYQAHIYNQLRQTGEFSRDDEVRITKALEKAVRGDDTLLTVQWDGEPTRVYVTPIEFKDGRDNGYQASAVGESLEGLNETLDTIQQALLAVSIAALAASILAGYLLTAQTLKPVTEITSLAASIDEHDLYARLHLNLPKDELGDLQETLNTMLDRIEVAFERQKRFTSDAAHELRTPISLLRGEVDVVLGKERSGDEYRETLGEMGGTLDRMSRLTSSLLTLARLDVHGYTRTSEPFQLDDTLTGVVETYQSVADAHGIQLKADVLPVKIVGDVDIVVRVAVNLLDNAIAATPINGKITVSCAPADGGAIWEVRDTGVGIAKEDQSRIFDRFYRPDGSRSRNQGGVGLGLAICSTLLKASDASIAVTSDVGDGSLFTVRMPATNEPNSEFIKSSF